ncbi:MAG TPA: CHASE domain-containing protein, partial [Acidimicrobiales bacterium]|nr:CHASE domain-containing protein [Acidimicrobiales bacterium]
MADRTQTPAGRPVTPSAPALPRIWPRVVAVALVVVVGVVAAWGVARAARDDADRRERLLAQQTANLAESTAQQLLAAISGASGLADETGAVRADAFRAYALGTVEASPFQTLAYAPVVPAEGRAMFEAATGHPIVDAPGAPPAGPRDLYLPVQWVVPMVGVTDQLIGFDLLNDDARRAAAEQARDGGEAVVSPVVPGQPNRAPSIIVAHPVYRAGAPVATVEQRRMAIAGVVVTGVQGDGLFEAIDSQLGGRVSLRVEDAAPAVDEPLPLFQSNPPPRDGVAVERTIGGRPWRITVDDRRGVPVAAPWWLLVATGALAGTLAVLA